MKKYISNSLSGVVAAALAAGLWSCSAENPFDTDGTGTVHLRTVVNAITTRAEDDADVADREQSLRDNCVVYISNSKGLIYRAKGLDNVDESITLKSGHYVAEAWSGDSVTASFDKMFFRGYQPFDVSKGDNTNVVVNCKIMNVVASINTATINPDLMRDDYTITIKNSRGELVFDKNNAGNTRGYFMMPSWDSNLQYVVKGTRRDGDPFEKSGVIENVQSAHQYILNFEYNPDFSGSDDPEKGAVFVQIVIKDEIIAENQTVTVPGAPTLSGEEFRLDKQQDFTSDADIPEELLVKVCAFGNGYRAVTVSSESLLDMGLLKELNFVGLDSSIKTQCDNAGISLVGPDYKEYTNVSTAYLRLSKDFIRNLSADKESEHIFDISVNDKNGQTSTAQLRIARSERQIVLEDPIVAKPIDTSKNLLNLTGSTAVIGYSIASAYEGEPGIEYRMSGDINPAWQFVAIENAVSDMTGELKLTGFTPGTTYEYRACCGDFHSDDVMTFTTESAFALKEASFEEWSTYSAQTLLGKKNVILPSATGDKMTAFWGSGNEGSATANLTLTDKSTDMVHSGTYSARLESKSALGVIAAGNLFVGYYVKTDGTDGVLSLGREYNGSHPSSVRVYANYRPASGVSIKSGNEGYVEDLQAGGKDHGQIYVALVNGAYEVRTKASDRKLFDRNDPQVVAYGQVTWKDDFGPDGQLQLVEIPFEYNENAKTTRPTHVVIVCSATKFGDYFSGASGSVMYVDDFELVY